METWKTLLRAGRDLIRWALRVSIFLPLAGLNEAAAALLASLAKSLQDAANELRKV